MRKDLNGWLGRGTVHATRHAKLGADVICASRRRVSRQRGLRKVSPLLRLVLDEGGGIEIGLWNGDIKDTGAGRNRDWDGHVDACFGSCCASKRGHCEGGFGRHVCSVSSFEGG